MGADTVRRRLILRTTPFTFATLPYTVPHSHGREPRPWHAPPLNPQPHGSAP